eukprot:15453873-Alexandrium_andersonii.AAC.1
MLGAASSMKRRRARAAAPSSRRRATRGPEPAGAAGQVPAHAAPRSTLGGSHGHEPLRERTPTAATSSSCLPSSS